MLRLDATDTIAAAASPPGPGLRGIVRLSGPDAWGIALSGFEPDRRAPLPVRAEMRQGWLRVDGIRPALKAMLALWPEPRTYTRQALAEIHTVGSPPLLRQVLVHCLGRGARHAEPGEFTLRAFLSGRLDLTRAEAVLDVIDAGTPAQLDGALQQLAGGIARPITALRDRLLDMLAHLEANLDFADEPDVDPLGRASLAAELDAGAADLGALAERLRGRDRPEGHPKVVLVGPPNAGKSRLFNALVGAPRAIVSPLGGTTRDYLSALVECDGLSVELIDTAGMDVGDDIVERQAQAQRASQVEQADLLLACESFDTEAPSLHRGRPSLRVATKCDVTPAPEGLFATSAATGEGLALLRTALAETIRHQRSEGPASTCTGARCHESLVHAGESLAAASETLQIGGGDELVAIDLRVAIEELGKVVGASVSDDILERIFRRFCIGK
jgi:tRNA modification GTPase